MTAYDPFAEFAAFDTKPTPAPAAPVVPQQPKEKKPIMSSYQPAMQQQQPQQPTGMGMGMGMGMSMGGMNPFGGYGAPAPAPSPPQQQPNPMMMGQQQPQPPAPAPAPVPVPYQQQPQQMNSMVPAPQPANQWAQQAPPQQQPPAPAPYQQQVSPPQQMLPHSGQSLANGSLMTAVAGNHGVASPQSQQSPYAQEQVPPQQQNPYYNQPAPVPTQNTAPQAVVQEDNDDFFGDFSNNSVKESPNRPPSVFEANQNDDVSYLSKSTGGTERGASILDDPKFAPKPPAVHGLANAHALAQHAPPGASPLPDFDQVSHSGYVLARISFRTILIKKWKQSFWVMYGSTKVLFFRSSADFEDWISNPYLSQAQRDFLVKLRIDFAGDLNKQGVRGYQVTPQRLKNYNNKMLHQFKLERWMDYGPTIAAAFASPNERELKNLRTVFTELLKRTPQNTGPSRQPHPPGANMYQQGHHQGQHPQGQYNTYGQSPSRSMDYAQPPSADQNYYSSSASVGYGQTGSVYSQQSQRSYGVMSAGPVEMSRDQYVAGYRATASPPGRY